MTSTRKEAIRLLAAGREDWNKWRLKLEYAPLSLADLRLPEADLRGFDFRGCNLKNAVLPRIDGSAMVAVRCNLDGADLTDAILTGAALGGASLRKASMRGADLSGTDLTETCLDGADLRRTDLQGSDLRGASVAGTRFDEAVFGWTMLANMDLTAARGLHRTIHRAPSTLGLDVIQRARKRLPEALLRGVGVAEELISFLSAPLGKRFRLPSTFISYSFKDSAFAKKLHGDLQQSGIRCWLAEKSLDIGEPIDETIAQTIRSFDALILVFSRDALLSSWVRAEVEYAIERERETGKSVILPVTVDQAVSVSRQRWVTQIRTRLKIGDFTQWQDAGLYAIAFDDLLHALGARGQVSRHPLWR